MPQKATNPANYAKNGSEHGNQVALFCWASQNFEIYPCLKLMYAIPNGGQRNFKVASQLKAEGVRAGVLDVCLPVPIAGFHGLYLELKVGVNKPTKEQYWYIDELRKQGYAADWVIGWEVARDRILAYLNQRG